MLVQIGPICASIITMTAYVRFFTGMSSFVRLKYFNLNSNQSKFGRFLKIDYENYLQTTGMTKFAITIFTCVWTDIIMASHVNR